MAFAGREDPDSTTHSESVFYGSVDYDSIGLNIIVTIDSGQLSGSMDSSYASLEITGFTNADSTDTLVTPENTFWSGSIFYRYGEVPIVTGELTLDEMYIDPATDFLTVLAGHPKIITIPFPGSVEEFENAGLELHGDVGFGDPALADTADIPTLTEWGMIIFCALLFAWMAWVLVRRRKQIVQSC